MATEIDPNIKLLINESAQTQDREFRGHIEKLEARLRHDFKRSSIRDASLVVLFSLLSAFGVYTTLKQHFDTVVTKKITDYSLDTLQQRASVAAKSAEESARIAKQEVSNLRGDDPLVVRNIHMLPAGEYIQIVNKTGGEHLIDLTKSFPKLPAAARGIILKVIISSPSGSGSIICTDSRGNYAPTLVHYLQNGFTNYSASHIGGLLICPILEGKRAVQFKTSSNKAATDGSIETFASIIGWYD